MAARNAGRRTALKGTEDPQPQSAPLPAAHDQGHQPGRSATPQSAAEDEEREQER